MTDHPDPVKAALWWVERGAGVFPVWGVTDDGTCRCPKGKDCEPKQRGKHPATPHGFLDATSDETSIRKFLSNPGTPNYGVRLPKGWGGFDVDGEGKTKWEELQHTLGPLPVTLTIRSANGFHYIFDWGDEPVPPNLHGYIVRSWDKGYIVGIGSRHASGVYYDAVRPLATVAPLPITWRGETKRKTNGIANASITVGGMPEPESIIAGQGRHDYIRDKARTLFGNGLTGEALYAACDAFNQRFSEPLSRERMERAIDEGRLQQNFQRDPEVIPLTAAPVGAQVEQTEYERITSGLVYASQATPSPTANDWLIEGLVRPKGIVVLAGPEGLGKSWMRVELAIRLTTGTGSLFDVYPIKGQHFVLLLDEENGEDIEFEREDEVLDALGLTRADLGGRYLRQSFGMTDLETKEGREAFETRIDAAAPEVVIIDTGGVTVSEEHGSAFMQTMRYVRSVSEALSIVVIFVVHLVKPLHEAKERALAMKAGRTLAEVMGHWGRHADSVWQLSDAGDGKLHFHVRKRWGESYSILARDNALFKAVKVITPTTASVRRGNDQRILDTLKNGGPAKVRGTASILDYLAKFPDKVPTYGTVHSRLKVMAEEGLVAADDEGVWSITADGEAALVVTARASITLLVDRPDE
jgi:Bifunctional DNA primase/polymerase, N-terminal/AAA domain